MKKKIMAYALLAGMLFSASATVRAESHTAESDVSFTSENTLSADYTNAEVNEAVYNLQPGDDITITLHLKNDNPSAANWYMTNEVLQSLEETTGSSASGGAYEYELIYTGPDGSQEILFTSDTVGGENDGSRVGLKAATSGLEDYLYLDTIAPGQQGLITLRVALDGETEGNSYQNTLASLQMNFAVDTTTEYNETITEVVDEEGNPVPENTASPSSRTGIVRTSDESNMLPLVIAAAVSGLLLLLLAILGVRERRKQKGGMKTMTILMAACLVCGMGQKAEAAEYTYTLRLFAGAQGVLGDEVVQRITDAGAQISIENGEICVISGLHYGTQVVFDVQKGVTISNDSKYYNKGFRVSGEDNSSSKLANPSITVTEDQDYVMAYGIQGETVAYTVNYLDGDGNVLFPSATYYGNVGDKPVVAYQYVEGWQPQAYNLGKTLAADASQNVFDFIYTPVPTVVTTNTVVVPGQPAPEVPGPEVPAPEVPVPPAPEVPEPVDEDIPDREIPTDDGPDDYRDLDEEDTPTGNFDGNGDGNGEEESASSIIEDLATPLALLPTPAKVGIVSAVVVLAGAGICLAVAALRKGKKKNEQ
ncbi:MAG TPA: hypothetical protein DCZ91_12170 [Lachnospiraceae bacterium]|nr:hypothetical protein [Lachnospiraceae bacterium]